MLATIVKRDGAVDTWSFKIPYDGRNHAFRISDQDGKVVTLYDTVAIKQIDANKFEYTWLGPTLRDLSLVVISEDGRTMTATDRREYHDGRIWNTKYVYRKQ